MDDAAGKRNDAEDAKEKLYTYASYVPCTNFKGTVTEVSFAQERRHWLTLIGS